LYLHPAAFLAMYRKWLCSAEKAALQKFHMIGSCP